MTGFRDDFSNVVASTESFDIGSGVLSVQAVQAGVVYTNASWLLQDTWFTRRAGSLRVATSFGEAPAGLGAPPVGTDWYAADGELTLSGGAAAATPKGAGVLGVLGNITAGLNAMGWPRLVIVRASDGAQLAAVGGPIVQETLRRETLSGVTHASAQAGSEDPVGLSGIDVGYFRIDADTTTGRVTCSLTADELGVQVRDAVTWASALPADGEPVYAIAQFLVSMQGPAYRAQQTPPLPVTAPEPIFSVYSWAWPGPSTVVAGAGSSGALRN